MIVRITLIALSCIVGTASAQDPPIIPEPATNTRPTQQQPASGDQDRKADKKEASVAFRPLQAISLGNAIATAPDLRLPENLAAEHVRQYGILTDDSGYRPTPLPARNLHLPWYQPLYFEDPNLERCGRHHGCLTDAVSVAWFFGRVPVLPYMKAETSPHDCVASLGDCGPCQKFGVDAYLPPPDLKAAAYQAVATIGFVFLIP